MQIIAGMQAYAGLPHIKEAPRFLEERDGGLMQTLGEMLVEAGVDDIFGIAFPLHYHLRLAANEVVVEMGGREISVAEPRSVIAAGDIYPGLIRFGNDGAPIVLQWNAGVDDQAVRVEAFMRSVELTRIKAKIGDNSDRYGLARITELDRNVPEGMVWNETEESRSLVKRLTPLSALDPDRTVKTLWVFGRYGKRIIGRCPGSCSTDANGNHMFEHAG